MQPYYDIYWLGTTEVLQENCALHPSRLILLINFDVQMTVHRDKFL